MHYHLDPVGGIAGDMFVGSLLDLHPELANDTIAAVRAAGLETAVSLAHVAHTDGVLNGSRFDVGTPPVESHHHHVHWSSLREQLATSALASGVRDRAIAIFSILADAEARVHDKPVEEVAFHEVGAWDSIADIVAAASVIEALGPATWSIGVIPIGNGRVKSAHGLLPVPAPATVLLLEGYRCFDDGYPGERVTPTGAAIIRYLDPAFGIGRTQRALGRCGYGFGTRTFDGLSNVLRVIAFDEPQAVTASEDTVTVIEFEVDDQSAEDLALGLDRIRAGAGVVDVVQMPVVGKRGRLGTTVRVLAQPAFAPQCCELCFRETTTLGLRLQQNDRIILRRREVSTGDGINVKIVERPGGPTAKAQLRDVDGNAGHDQRQRARRRAEDAALRVPDAE